MKNSYLEKFTSMVLVTTSQALRSAYPALDLKDVTDPNQPRHKDKYIAPVTENLIESQVAFGRQYYRQINGKISSTPYLEIAQLGSSELAVGGERIALDNTQIEQLHKCIEIAFQKHNNLMYKANGDMLLLTGKISAKNAVPFLNQVNTVLKITTFQNPLQIQNDEIVEVLNKFLSVIPQLGTADESRADNQIKGVAVATQIFTKAARKEKFKTEHLNKLGLTAALLVKAPTSAVRRQNFGSEYRRATSNAIGVLSVAPSRLLPCSDCVTLLPAAAIGSIVYGPIQATARMFDEHSLSNQALKLLNLIVKQIAPNAISKDLFPECNSILLVISSDSTFPTLRDELHKELYKLGTTQQRGALAPYNTL